MNELDRFHLAQDAADMVYGAAAGEFSSAMDAKLAHHKDFIHEEGTDLPEVEGWQWKQLD